MSKLDPGLKYLNSTAPMDRRSASRVFSLGPAAAPAPEIANVMVELERAGDVPAALTAAGFVPRTRAGAVLTGNIPIERIPLLEGIPELKRAEASRGLRRELDHALPAARVVAVHNASPPHRGAGVIVAIIDHGIDYRHESFRNEDGTSRILAIWDQSLIPREHESSPAGFDYGVEYTQESINAAIPAPDPASIVAHRELAPFHGTHVAGIAAGNGRAGDATVPVGAFVGVAPEASLIIVANTRGLRKDPGSLGDSADTLDAVSYILQMAASLGKAVAINLSQGDNVGPHDGTSLLEVGIANLIQGPGRALIKSAGNEGATRRHAEGVIPSARSQTVEVDVADDEQQVIIDIWYSGVGRIALSITPPGSSDAGGVFAPPFNDTVRLSNGNDVFIDADLADPGNGDNRTFVVLQPGSQNAVQAGIWTFHLAGDGAWHAWIQRDSGAAFRPPFVTSVGTISIPGTSTGVIVVGSFISNDSFTMGFAGELSELSSRGPTRDGRRAPTLAAPGEEITAPQPKGQFAPRKGTSMAAAMVTGAVALLFGVRPTATADDVRRCLEQTARLDRNTGSQLSEAWGAGKIDVEAACRHI